MHRHLGIIGHKGRHHAADASVQDRHRAGHAHRAAGLGARLFDRLLRRFRFHQHRLAVRVIGLADFGHREVPRRTLDQAHAQPLLQQRHAAAELGFGNAQRPAGGGESLVIDHAGEEKQIVQIGQHRIPYRSISRTLSVHLAYYCSKLRRIKLLTST